MNAQARPPSETVRAVCTYLRHHARGRPAAVRLDDLAAVLNLSRRTIEKALHQAACEARPIGTSCENLEGDSGEGASPAGMGAFWIVTIADWQAAMDNLNARFRPLADRVDGLVTARLRIGDEPVAEARRALAAVTGEGPAVLDKRGQGLLFGSIAPGSRT